MIREMLCSLGFVSLPIRVRAFSKMSAELSKVEVRMRLWFGSAAGIMMPFPFSDAEYLLLSMAGGCSLKG